MGGTSLEISSGLAPVWCIVLLVEILVKFAARYLWAPSEGARVNFVLTHDVRVQLKKVWRQMIRELHETGMYLPSTKLA